MRRLQRFLLFLIAVASLSVVFASPAAAELGELEEASNAVEAGGELLVTVPIGVWNIFVGAVLPFLVALLTKVNGRSGVKIVVQFVLSAVTGLVGTAVVADGVAILSSTSIVNAGLTFFLSTIAYLGWYKKASVPEALPGANKGFG